MLWGRTAALVAAALAAVLVACAEDTTTSPAALTATATPPPSVSPSTTPTTEATQTVAPNGVSVGVSAATGSVTPIATVDPLSTEDWGQVISVVDGDTVDLLVAGQEQRIRLILVDTPEVFGGTDCYGPEASARTKALLPPGTVVELVRDVSETDRFGRLLRYIYLPDGRMLNEVLVAEGFATLATYPPDIAEVDRIRAAQTAARDAGRGLWGACASVAMATPTASATATSTASATAAPTKTPTPAATAQAACDTSYPDVCIPPYPPDLDCGEIPFRRFRVVGADPHGFDRDRDGIGCES